MLKQMRAMLAIIGFVAVALAGSGMAVLAMAQQADPGADCYATVVKDGYTWSKQGTGWTRTVGQDTYSMANYMHTNPEKTKTLNCSTNEWADD